MWPFTDRRRTKRYAVDWEASLQCDFADHLEVMSTRVLDVSLGGACIALERLQVGSYHLVIGDHLVGLELSIPKDDGLLKLPVEICWYNWDDEKRLFAAGVRFLSGGSELEPILKQMIKAP